MEQENEYVCTKLLSKIIWDPREPFILVKYVPGNFETRSKNNSKFCYFYSGAQRLSISLQNGTDPPRQRNNIDWAGSTQKWTDVNLGHVK